ncbi:hypothetical protein BZA05DRAFT_182898 [Tricharina praecox]|uniref:uncharacterized protein n=1 Tax=Tricharina praecox TaxID=43433 RepID=UPI002220AA8B|nr:uncharacterized protein BZA05DRAFT_182898 [Tricharina praecox]KAI5843630.1 hypothetical protein BZA05DRAFT_182898 [Tricharina praecox]
MLRLGLCPTDYPDFFHKSRSILSPSFDHDILTTHAASHQSFRSHLFLNHLHSHSPGLRSVVYQQKRQHHHHHHHHNHHRRHHHRNTQVSRGPSDFYRLILSTSVSPSSSHRGSWRRNRQKPRPPLPSTRSSRLRASNHHHHHHPPPPSPPPTPPPPPPHPAFPSPSAEKESA